MRPLATTTHDTLSWYGFDADGGGVHDVIGTRCDPYTQLLLAGTEYHQCCHSNLTRALSGHTGLPLSDGVGQPLLLEDVMTSVRAQSLARIMEAL